MSYFPNPSQTHTFTFPTLREEFSREVNSDPIIAQHDVYSNSPFKRTGNKVLPCEILKQGDPRAESFKGMIRAR